MKPRRILLIGPSASGKTTVAQAIARELGLPVISMDDYRTKLMRSPQYVMHDGEKVRNYESIDNWDANAIQCKLRALCQNGMGFVAEGNHLLQYPAIAAIPDTERYYIDVPFAVSLARRKTRNRGIAPDWSFQKIGERMTAEIVAPQKAFPGVRVLDGTLPASEIARMILQPVAA